MRILVVGAGGTGGYYGGRLLQAGRDVSFLVRPKRAAALREKGLRIVSPAGDATLQPSVLTAEDLGAQSGFDLVLLGVKAYGLAQAMDDLAPAVGPETMILPVLNGLRHIDRLVARFGQAAVLGGVSRIAATVDAEGRIVHMSPFQYLGYGERDAARSGDPTRLAKLHEQLSGAVFESRLSEEIDRDMWEKWVFLATLGGITCLMRGTVGEIEAVPGGAALTLQLLHELAAVSAASGQTPTAAFMAQSEAMLTAAGSGLASSMYRDMQQGSQVEVEQILGDMALRADQLGVATPLLTAALAQLRIYQRRVEKTG